MIKQQVLLQIVIQIKKIKEENKKKAEIENKRIKKLEKKNKKEKEPKKVQCPRCNNIVITYVK